MCGVAGIFLGRGGDGESLRAQVRAMRDTLVHRGPDDAGDWCDTGAGIALGHRRLSILDLSAEGHQPMQSADGRYVLAYNGEIYNWRALRTELEVAGHRFRGHADTEVLLAGFVQWGVTETLQKANGMFAFALWDRERRRLCLARDRMGKKPLYYGRAGKAFIFGSELKALRAYPGFHPEVDRGALALFLRYRYVPVPHSIYRGVAKLPPGGMLWLDAADLNRDVDALEVERFWSAADCAHRGQQEPVRAPEGEIIEQLDGLLRDSTGLRMVADVELGAFLSGGIDSSTVVSVMQALSERPVRTFSIGFDQPEMNEADQAAAVAAHLGTEHTELHVGERDLLDVVPKLPTLFDEPFADTSQIPTYLVAELARRHVTVALSGDGGDELFFGYRRYFRGMKIWRARQRLPRVLTGALARLLDAFAPSRFREHDLHRLAQELRAGTLAEMYRQRTSIWYQPTAVVKGSSEPPSTFDEVFAAMHGLDPGNQMMLIDLVTYLTDDILAKVDRASMGVSLEARNPLLDYRVVEFAWRLPLELKYRDGRGKYLLRHLLSRYLPERLIDRPKRGFGAPVGAWLDGPLRDWCEALLDEDRLKREGYFDPAPIRRMWSEHRSGRRRWHTPLWNILMFQAWLERNL
ncbi:MAG: asparagine synthase (glutamine-hydrolyzing) [Gammaproteobacteria bacterium]